LKPNQQEDEEKQEDEEEYLQAIQLRPREEIRVWFSWPILLFFETRIKVVDG
jgi:hypothetical protein